VVDRLVGQERPDRGAIPDFPCRAEPVPRGPQMSLGGAWARCSLDSWSAALAEPRIATRPASATRPTEPPLRASSPSAGASESHAKVVACAA
jgi:hypothetical protein